MNGRFLASAPRGLADLLAAELATFGAQSIRERGLGVAFEGDLGVAYRACLESRVASRVFLEIAHVRGESADDLYAALLALPWEGHVDPAGTLACDYSGQHPAIRDTRYGVQRVKDAICDRLRERCGGRPDIQTTRPGVRVHVHANGPAATVSIDLAGEGLHRRGYREEAGEAPLRENVAAGILLRSGWTPMAAEGAELLDPLCGSGTIVIEAALIAANRAPGLLRDYYGFLKWRGHDEALWQRLLGEARGRAANTVVSCAMRGSDRDDRVIRVARDNARRAGVDALVSFDVAELGAVRPVAARGLLCTNPPYGVRLEDKEGARAVHRTLGEVLREHFQGWRAAVITGAPELGLELGLRAVRTHTVWNGAIECRLLRFEVETRHLRDYTSPREGPRIDPALAESPGAKMFANRLAKNFKRLSAWAESAGVSCYRVYDADMPEYAFAIDLYREADSARRWAYVQEYAAPREIELEAVRRRRGEALASIPSVLDLPAQDVRLKMRRRTKRGEQYEKTAETQEFHVVEENGLRFRVNFADYLDTGLFLDHRLTRARLRAGAARRRFLNLFAYTGTATVYAAAGRARSTTSVDLSRTYLQWAEENLALNGLSGRQHRMIHADCRAWLADAARLNERFDLIFLDPPTFSNSKRMTDIHDVQRDHPALIDQCMAVLAPEGLLVFSNNAQKFRLDPAVQERYDVRDISRETIPEDYARNLRIHVCFEIRARSGRILGGIEPAGE